MRDDLRAISPSATADAPGIDPSDHSDGMVLSSTVPANCPLVLIDGSRTLRAFSTVLLTARALSGARDHVEMIASSSINGMQIMVRNLNLSMTAANAEAKLSMAAAEANVLIFFQWKA
jgi:hypothetical protein